MKGRKILNVPYIRQKVNYCGPAALAMILNYHSVNTDQDKIGSKANSQYFGMTLGELEKAATERGFGTEIKTKTDICDLLSSIDQGNPVIVAQHMAMDNKDIHYRVVVGYDSEKSRIIIHDPQIGEYLELSEGIFLELWHSGKFDRVALMIRRFVA